MLADHVIGDLSYLTRQSLMVVRYETPLESGDPSPAGFRLVWADSETELNEEEKGKARAEATIKASRKGVIIVKI